MGPKLSAWNTLLRVVLVLALVPVSRSSHLSRISLAGVEPSLVQAALGQLVRLSCSDDTAPESQAAWQKDGQPISSDRWVTVPHLL